MRREAEAEAEAETKQKQKEYGMREFVGIGVFIALATVWYFAWVRPHDQFLTEVAVCMGSDMSEEAYEGCVEIVQHSR